MINHYVNLVCWEDISDNIQIGRDIIWCDSITMLIVLRLFGKKVEYRPGTKVALTLQSGDPGQHVFGPTYIESFSSSVQTVLPIIDDVAAFKVSDDLIDVLSSLEHLTRVYLGISSPKQNNLAIKFHEIRPDLEYHCLGAALAFGKVSIRSGKFTLSGSGLEWLRFLYVDPSRTLRKICDTIHALIAILLDHRTREKFKSFSQHLE